MIGIDFLQPVGANVAVGRKKRSVGSVSQPLLDSYCSHFALELKPEKYRAPTE